MPTGGVIRPYTLVDILNTIYQVSSTPLDNGGVVITVGIVAEVDEVATTADLAFATTSTSLGWDQGVWNGFAWS